MERYASGSVKLSIVIPVYNAQRYLPALFCSIERQKNDGVEIIMIDDGSEDDSVSLIEEYCRNHSNASILKINHQGAPYARNEGIRHAEGEYIYFFDSDDRFEPGAFAEILNIIENDEEIDLILGNGWVINEKGEHTATKFSGLENKSDMSWTDLFFLDSNPGNKVFSARVIHKHNIFWDPVAIHQDLNFYLKYILMARKIRTTSLYLYGYLVHEGSISRTISSKIEEVADSMDYVLDFYIRNNAYEQNKTYLIYNYVKHICIQIRKLWLLEDVNESERIYERFEKILFTLDYKKNPFIRPDQHAILDEFFDSKDIYKDKEKYKQRHQRLQNAALEKSEAYRNLYYNWLSMELQGKAISTYLRKKGIDNIAIYGKGSSGMMLYEYLKKEGTASKYFIDANAGEIVFGSAETPVLGLEDISSLGGIDMIIISPIHAEKEIEKNLDGLGIHNYIALDRLISEVMEE